MRKVREIIHLDYDGNRRFFSSSYSAIAHANSIRLQHSSIRLIVNGNLRAEWIDGQLVLVGQPNHSALPAITYWWV